METVRDTLNYYPYAGIIHIRFMGQDDTVYSQPAFRKLPVFSVHVVLYPCSDKMSSLSEKNV